MEFHYSAKNLTRKKGKDICYIGPNEKRRDWEPLKDQPVSRFNCKLQSRQCEYIIPQSRRRCKLNTRRALPYCWLHAQIVDHVIISKSLIRNAGMGLFACDRNKSKHDVVFHKGDTITMYARKGNKHARKIGEFMTDDQINDRYGECTTAPYGIDSYKARHAVDTACERSIGSYANGSKTAKDANAEIVWFNNRELILVATKKIYNGDEITWYYGKEYLYEYPEFFEYKVSHTGRRTSSAKCRYRKRR